MPHCAHRLADGPLACVLPSGHDHGHVYESTSSADDKHTEGGHG
jgi:hypothetical protein